MCVLIQAVTYLVVRCSLCWRNICESNHVLQGRSRRESARFMLTNAVSLSSFQEDEDEIISSEDGDSDADEIDLERPKKRSKRA